MSLKKTYKTHTYRIEFKAGQTYFYEMLKFILDKIDTKDWWMPCEDNEEIIKIIEYK